MNALKQKRLDFYRLVVATHDLDAALAALELISLHVTEDTDRLNRPLLYSAVVSYARPFIGNSRYGPLPGRWSRFADSSHQARHQAMIAARHEIAAHNDADLFQLTVLPPGSKLIVNELEQVIDEVSYILRSGYSFDLNSIPEYIATCKFQRERMYERISLLKDEVLTPEEMASGNPFVFEP
jgi:hypothetical protein